MCVPDPMRVGGLEWTQTTGGRLSVPGGCRVTLAILRGYVTYVGGRAKLCVGHLPSSDVLDLGELSPPNGPLAREAERLCDEQPPAIAAHAYRTSVFARALSELDNACVDAKLLYAGSLLHDTGLMKSVTGEDFTLRSAQCARRCLQVAGQTEDEDLLCDAITAHATPGITVEHDGSLATYIQAGAMLDLIGLRKWDLPASVVELAERDHPRLDIKDEITKLVRAEASAVHCGRFWLLRYLGLNVAIRIAPFHDRT